MKIFKRKSDLHNPELNRGVDILILERIENKLDETIKLYKEQYDIDLNSNEEQEDGVLVLIEKDDNIINTLSNLKEGYIPDENLYNTCFEFVDKYSLRDEITLYEGLAIYSDGSYFVCYLIPDLDYIPRDLIQKLEELNEEQEN
jgi:hypothetical protein